MSNIGGDDGGVSIGGEDQRRDQEMLEDKLRTEATEANEGADPFETPEEQRRHQRDRTIIRDRDAADQSPSKG